MVIRRIGRRPILAGLALVASLSCDQRESAAQQRSRSRRDEATTRARELSRIRVRTRSGLVESSGAAMSSSQPGVLFTINDSGNDPLLFAIDTTGSVRGTWRVQNAQNLDWEAVSIGPCSTQPKSSAVSCVYVGDVGDNLETIPVRAIYRMPEPSADDRSLGGAIAAERLTFRYADGPHDVEAMYVAPNGDTYLITKRRLVGLGNRLRPALVFRLAAAAWGRGTAVAELVDSLAVVPGSAPDRQITDAALSLDGRWLAVRTYRQVFVFATDSATGRVRGAIPPSVCNIVSFSQRQGEGITWFGRSEMLLLTSEGRQSPMVAVDCPMPRSE